MTICGLNVISCSTDTNQHKSIPQTKQAVAESKIQEPFHFHEVIEVKPGLTFDVLSWGRGAQSGGSYLILRSDSVKLKFQAISGNLDGKITDAWNMDMDSDGNPEIFIQAQGQGKGSYLSMYVYEFDDSGSYQQIPFPELAASKSYRGGDSIYIKNGMLMREFPIYEKSDTLSKTTKEKKIITYQLRNNSLIALNP